MTTITPPRHTKKRLIKTVGAHTLCSCGHIQDGELYFYIKDYLRDTEKASHTYKQEGRMVWDEELMVNGLETIKIPTNILLEKRIKIVTNIAQPNYESRLGK